jgi:anti-anti-sigma factor
METLLESAKDGIVTTEEQKGVMVVNFHRGRIREEREVMRILVELGQFIDTHPGCKVLVNMANVEYLSSAGLGSLVGLLKKSRKGNGQFKLCSLQKTIFELFEVMRLTKIFEFYDDDKAALASFPG